MPLFVEILSSKDIFTTLQVEDALFVSPTILSGQIARTVLRLHMSGALHLSVLCQILKLELDSVSTVTVCSAIRVWRTANKQATKA